MLRRNRTTKALATRVDMNYFARPHWLRSWRVWLSVAVPLVALGWFFTQRAQGGQKMYPSGPLSASHAAFTKQCSLCHLQQTGGGYFLTVEDKACLTCHDAPVHHANQMFTPSCTSCHIEHKGALRLRATATASCTECHSDLQTKEGASKFEASVTSFERKHPDFRAARFGAEDPGGLKLNHYAHLQPNLIGPNHTRVQMTCDDCHRFANVSEALPYPGIAPQLISTAASGATTEPSPIPHTNPRAYLAAPEFAKHCAGCHVLDFDRRFGSDQVPHDKPQIVREFLTKKFTEYIAAHPEAVHQVEPPVFDRSLPQRARVPNVARNASEWVAYRVEDAEWLLYSKTCKQCHTLDMSRPLPEVTKASITPRWMPHGKFDHSAHLAVTCSSCHVKTADSRETSDVLIPGIASCRHCHLDRGPSHEAAEARCFECHQYHDWSKAKRVRGTYSIRELAGGQ
jgi:hypothetical protein